jgi:hypothetical protein
MTYSSNQHHYTNDTSGEQRRGIAAQSQLLENLLLFSEVFPTLSGPYRWGIVKDRINTWRTLSEHLRYMNGAHTSPLLEKHRHSRNNDATEHGHRLEQ